MLVALTFGSLGDITTVIGLAAGLGKTFSASRGAEAEYAAVIDEFDALEWDIGKVHYSGFEEVDFAWGANARLGKIPENAIRREGCF